MAITYSLITSTTLSTTATQVILSGIPASYDDLLLTTSLRTDGAGDYARDVRYQFNSDSATNYSNTILSGANAGAGGAAQTSVTAGWLSYNGVPSAGNTANAFSFDEMYISNYASAKQKQVNIFNAPPNNSGTSWYINYLSGGWRNTAAITSIRIFVASNNFVSGCSFYLYGIKNS